MFSSAVSISYPDSSCKLITPYQENARTDQQHIDTACSYASSLSSFDLWVIVGEWTPAKNDCGKLAIYPPLGYGLTCVFLAKYLNGRGVGSRYDGSYPGSSKIGSCTGLTGQASSFSSSYKTFLRKYWEAQTITYEKGQGWIQWVCCPILRVCHILTL